MDGAFILKQQLDCFIEMEYLFKQGSKFSRSKTSDWCLIVSGY
jgi:hypothetical protein